MTAGCAGFDPCSPGSFARNWSNKVFGVEERGGRLSPLMIELPPQKTIPVNEDFSVTDYSPFIAKSLNIKPTQVQAAVELLDAGNTIPFIARYRKEMTGTLDEEQLRQVQAEVERLRTLDERRTAVLASITEQEKLTPSWKKRSKRR
jgi:hypothetical protein